MQKEESPIAYTAWNGRAFFYKSARAVVGCDETERHRYRRQRQDSSTPEFSEWKPWAGKIGCGHFWSEDLRSVRAQLLAAGHQPKVALRGLCDWSALRLRASGGDCVIRELCEDAQVLQEWTQRLGVPYRGQRLAGASLEVFLHLLQRRRDNTSTCELDHIIPVRQAYQGQALELQALCFECHKVKTSMEGNHSTTLESRFCRYVYQNYAASPRPGLPAAEMGRRAPLPGRRCRKNGLANARFPIPVFCPLDCIVPAREGELADLTYVDLPFDGRRGLLDRLPYVGRDGTPSPLVRRCWTPGWRSGATFAGAWRPRRTWTNAGWSRRCRRWKRPGRKGRSTWPSSPSTRWWGSSPATCAASPQVW